MATADVALVGGNAADGSHPINARTGAIFQKTSPPAQNGHSSPIERFMPIRFRPKVEIRHYRLGSDFGAE